MTQRRRARRRTRAAKDGACPLHRLKQRSEADSPDPHNPRPPRLKHGAERRAARRLVDWSVHFHLLYRHEPELCSERVAKPLAQPGAQPQRVGPARAELLHLRHRQLLAVCNRRRRQKLLKRKAQQRHAVAPDALLEPRRVLAEGRLDQRTVHHACLRPLSVQEKLAQARAKLLSTRLRRRAIRLLRACLGGAREHRVRRDLHHRVRRDALAPCVARQSLADVAPQLLALGGVRQPLLEHVPLLHLAQRLQAGAAEHAKARLA
eukprot:scaffold8150_cov45-Tisochrysis_lutea.AAC.1